MRKIWLVITLCGVALLVSTALHRTNAQVGGCFNGVTSMPRVSAAPILKLGKFASPSGSLPQPSSINGRHSENGDATYTGGDLSNTATPPDCNIIIYPSNVPRIAGPTDTAFPQIFNATDMRFILAVEERPDDDGDGQNEFTQLQSLTLKFYSNDGCFSSAPNLFQTFTIPVNNCTLVTGYYVFSLSSQQAAALQPNLTQANNSAEDDAYCIYVGASMMVSRDDQFNTETTAGEILYVGNNTSAGCSLVNLTSTEKSFAGSGGSGAFHVTSAGGCLWNISGVPSWITLHSGLYGSGNETVRYSVQPNTTGSTRSATLTVVGAITGIVPVTYTITQTCNAISPDSQTFGSNGGNSAINVTPQGPGCGWLATESLSWVNITSGASGTSPGSIAYTVAANTQANAPGRSGVINVSEFTFEVKQAGPGGDCATLPITFGQSLTGTLSSGDCLSTVASTRPADRYSFTGTVGQRVSISLGNAFANATFALISPGGAVLTSSSQPLELPDAGSYAIEIYSSTANTFGSYTLSLCGYTINGDGFFFGPDNRYGYCIEVIEQGSCSYETSTGGLGWLSISRSGNYVCVRAQDNLGDSRRRGVILIAGKPIRVEQEPTDTFAVYSQADSGDGSLRKAIESANAVNRTATIIFDFYPAGPRTISPPTPLPTITNRVIIDGTTQEGYAGKPLIELDGSAAGFANGLEIANNGCQVKGLVINRFQRNGILMNCDFSEIANCYIGTDVSGTLDRGNTQNGIRVTGAANFIHDNLISGNNGAGIVSTGFGFDYSDAAIVRSNRIGTNAAGTAGIGNGSHGMDVNGTYTRIGDVSPSAGNIIAFNGGIGVRVSGGSGHSIIGNSIHSNGGLGIDLGGNGITPNDSGDGDSGENNLQNFPVLTSAVSAGGNTTIQGTLNSAANRLFRIDLFSSISCDASGNGEGQVFLASTDVDTNSGGNVSFSLIVPTNSINGPYLTATATNDNEGNSSEFSQCLSTCIPTLTPMNAGFPGNVGAGTPSLSGSIAVTLPAGCNWTAVSNDSFIVITGGSSGTGNGTVTYSLSANPSNTTLRTGTILVAGKTVTVLQGPQFLDVPANYLFYTEIGKLAARGITLGCGGGNYCPDAPVTREQMAAFIMRALGEPNPPTPVSQRFQDVPPSNFFYNFIDRLAELQITLGCGGSNYCPAEAVTREQMAAFLLRAKGEFYPPLPASQRFNDVPPSNGFYNFIDRLAELQVTLGCSVNPPLYCPGQSVTRAQMAAFLVRAFGF